MLRPIQLPELHDAPPSAKARELLAEADRRIDQFIHRRRGPLLHGFVASDFRAVDAHLQWILQRQLAAGHAFCEWGSGFGVVTMLAALHDFDACGIEVEAELVEQARCLAEDLDIPVQFAQGSLIPEGGDRLIKYQDDLTHLDTAAPSGYEELDLEMADFDLFFGFPWPGDEHFFEELFDRFAADGALLLTYHGGEGLRLQRRVRG